MIRMFEGAQHAKTYAEFRPKSSPDVVTKALAFMNTLSSEKRDQFQSVVDVGCGNGQSTEIFLPYFSKILGIDPSESQIKYANLNNTHGNISYKVGSAEELPVPSGSVDLIASGQAIHWVDFEKFFKECNRALKPDGCMLLHGYHLPLLSQTTDEDSEANALVVEFYNQCQWNDRLSHLLDSYERIYDMVPGTSKYRDAHAAEIVKSRKLSDLEQYFRTWSGYVTYQNKQKAGDGSVANRDDDILSVFITKLKHLWNVSDKSDDEINVNVKYPVFIVLSRRPNSSS